MAKNTQPAWVGKLRKQLKRAGEKDPDFSRFGAYSHKYQLNSPILEETIDAFEKRFNISLPEWGIGISCFGWGTAGRVPSMACILWVRRDPTNSRTTLAERFCQWVLRDAP